MRLKVCGMKDPENISELLSVEPDFMGMIFYEKSPRHVEGILDPRDTPDLGSVRLIGVFVDAEKSYVGNMVEKYTLKGVQLHGQESPDYCHSFREKGLLVLKAFSVGKEGFDFSRLKAYQGVVDYFLFDTKGKLPGGNGVSFRWDILSGYKGNTPFFLSGGISEDHVHKIREFNHPQLCGLDINSRFEIEPGLKDIERVRSFWKAVKGSPRSVS